MQSRNKREGTYKAYRFGKHFRSLKKLCKYIQEIPEVIPYSKRFMFSREESLF